MKISTARAVFAVVGLGFAGESAAATPPARCDTPGELQAFNAGVTSGQAFVRQAWGARNDCDDLERFAGTVMSHLDAVSVPPGSDDDVFCSVSGVLQGAEEEVDRIWRRCDEDCAEQGKLWGRLGALLYCEASIAAGGLGMRDIVPPSPRAPCGFRFQVACDAEFTSHARGYANASGSCLQYTRGAFEQVFRQARHNQCVYEPAP